MNTTGAAKEEGYNSKGIWQQLSIHRRSSDIGCMPVLAIEATRGDGRTERHHARPRRQSIDVLAHHSPWGIHRYFPLAKIQ